MKMSKTKILVVKDYANYCTELIGLLKDSGCFDVLPPVHDPRSVVDNVKENKPDLVILNATMAGSDGIEILIGIPVNLIGYAQLRKSILYCVENSLYQINLSQDVYQYVAECFVTTPKRVERNIRTAIEAAWSRGNIEAQHRYFGNTVSQSNGRPTNKEFIANITDRIVTHLRHS